MIPRIFLSNSIKKYQSNSHKDDKVIHYMVPNGLNQSPVENREKYIYWMSAMAKGLKEAILIYIALYERGMRRPFYISIPPQRRRRDVDIVVELLRDMNQHGYPITFLGELTYEKAMNVLRKSACLFRPGSPQETFGLVYLEANFLGVPVLTNSWDSAKEVLTDPNNMFIEKDTCIDDILKWMENVNSLKPTANLKKFGPDVITKKWMSLLK